MSYTTNPNLPSVRGRAADLVRRGWSLRKVGRYLGFHHTAVMKWVRIARIRGYGPIPTRSSRPHSHPQTLATEVVGAILEYRQRHRRCAKVLHHFLQRDGYTASLSSVERVLRRHGLVNHSPWKKWHRHPPRPLPERPGMLVQIDTIHDGPHDDRLYVYALLDVYSRWGWASPSERITTHRSLAAVERAQTSAPFVFRTLQSDHGAEFSKWFSRQLAARGCAHRHIHIRSPSENGHIERFIRTLQEECLNRVPRTLKHWEKELPEYLHFYNTERPHLGINMQTPLEVVTSY